MSQSLQRNTQKQQFSIIEEQDQAVDLFHSSEHVIHVLNERHLQSSSDPSWKQSEHKETFSNQKLFPNISTSANKTKEAF